MKLVQQTYREEGPKVSRWLIRDAPYDAKHTIQRLEDVRQLHDCRKQTKDALPSPAQVGVVTCPAVCATFEHAGGPREHSGAQTLHGDHVHPFLQVDVCTVVTLELLHDFCEDAVNGGLVSDQV